MTVLFQARGLRKAFGNGEHRRYAVDGVDITVAEGEALALAGESGSGKSTIGLIMARLLDHDEGEILFDGQEIGKCSARRAAQQPWRAQIQMVFQDAGGAFDPRLSISDSVALPLRRLSHSRGNALTHAVEDALDRAGLAGHLFRRKPHELSGGQLARAGIARAIALRPRLLILDEPTAALDVSVQAGILHLLNELRRDLNMAMVFVSHDLNVLRVLCSRVMVMEHGNIVEEGPVGRVFASPAHPFTTRLLAALPKWPRSEGLPHQLPGSALIIHSQ
ncbi:ABC transporter ATP-binding protein [Acidisoma silvae]|uniref:ATP-binding cassette domain-containing protein n=1 Tax=Acidisoma silvae TaxID=2802396 RepID=A0A964E198_9PROT|nr:ATP-binding cassette domain-containing protein [Acidisoma silvae]MCB8877994.1 ATP-binding cassette domain-containing protein [Acidisoma silvae]